MNTNESIALTKFGLFNWDIGRSTYKTLECVCEKSLA